MTLALMILAWVACGIGGAGLTFAYFQGQYPLMAALRKPMDLCFALAVGVVFGPLCPMNPDRFEPKEMV